MKCIWQKRCKNLTELTCAHCTRNLDNPFTFDYFETDSSKQTKGDKSEGKT